MTYVEWLRVRGALKWTSIVLAALFLLAVIGRIWAFGLRGDALSHIAQLQADRGSHVSETTGPGGARRTVIDDSRGMVHVTIDDYGWGRKHIEVLDRTSHGNSKETVIGGSISVRSLPAGGGSFTVIDVKGIPFSVFAIVAMLVALVVATILGSPFARENEGHLEIALTKPIGREALGFATVAVDAAGIIAAFAVGVAFALGCTALFEFPRPTFNATDVFAALLGIVAPLAWYALLNAATASMKRSYGTVVGFAWPVALLIAGLSRIHSDGNVLLLFVGGVFKALAVIDPLTYTHVSFPAEVTGRSIAALPLQFNVLALALLAAAYTALAILQWRRIEN